MKLLLIVVSLTNLVIEGEASYLLRACQTLHSRTIMSASIRTCHEDTLASVTKLSELKLTDETNRAKCLQFLATLRKIKDICENRAKVGYDKIGPN